jgi:uncharacterized membrane protein YedE/YeeE
MIDFFRQSWPWYVAGPLLGFVVPTLYVAANKEFGMSSSLRHICAIVVPGKSEFLKYDWRRTGLWNLVLALGLVLGGVLASTVLANPDPVVAISDGARAQLAALGITDFQGMMPREVFNFGELLTLRGLVMIVGGGFLVGFGSRYAGGCTSGHGISGLSNLQLPSLIAVLGFFAGGFVSTYLVLPLLF